MIQIRNYMSNRLVEGGWKWASSQGRPKQEGLLCGEIIRLQSHLGTVSFLENCRRQANRRSYERGQARTFSGEDRARFLQSGNLIESCDSFSDCDCRKSYCILRQIGALSHIAWDGPAQFSQFSAASY